ncbi:MAG: glycosyltransferase [Hydrogenophaga sp.]|uniref:CgeB family protein n=1 Tax=Hydrogenophaga sp. TaxID=1904254 RepID=UPI002603EC12|nr:glycosyltransferase [Hydrogenophaga sp.]MCV0439783.1 glycosyltransferase [Hydrogenophaga sp.]
MRILYVGLLYNYGKKDEGFSYEHFNIEAGIRDCASRGMFDVDIIYPDECDDIRRSATEMIIDEDYDAVFHVAFNESLDFPEAAAKMALRKDIPVIQWDCDSSWRFQPWILPRKDRVSHFITTHSRTVEWYQQNGMNVIRSQWAGSPYYHPQENSVERYDVSFVGQKHGQFQHGKVMKYWRAEVVDAIMAAGINLDLFGNYWDGYENWHGYQTNFHAMIRAFAESKICLNLSNPWHHGTMPQIKGRHFEIPQIGRLQVCTPADDLDSYFEADKEIIVAQNDGELIEKLRYYLEHPDEREKIAAAGRARMLKEHQWHHRFEHIFKEVGVL